MPLRAWSQIPLMYKSISKTPYYVEAEKDYLFWKEERNRAYSILLTCFFAVRVTTATMFIMMMAVVIA